MGFRRILHATTHGLQLTWCKCRKQDVVEDNDGRVECRYGNEASTKLGPVGLYSLSVVANWPCGMRQAAR